MLDQRNNNLTPFPLQHELCLLLTYCPPARRIGIILILEQRSLNKCNGLKLPRYISRYVKWVDSFRILMQWQLVYMILKSCISFFFLRLVEIGRAHTLRKHVLGLNLRPLNNRSRYTINELYTLGYVLISYITELDLFIIRGQLCTCIWISMIYVLPVLRHM